MERVAKKIDIRDLEINPFQNRTIFDDDKLAELAESIKNHGQRQPIDVLVHPISNKNIIIAGERRTRAQFINMREIFESGGEADFLIDAVVQYPTDIDEMNRILIVDMWNENEQSEGISIPEVAVFYRSMLRVKKVAGRKKYLYDSASSLAESLLGFKGLKQLSSTQIKVLNNKIKDISKKVRNYAKLTHYIENEIENNNNIDDKYLIHKLTLVGKKMSLTPISFGELRHKEYQKYLEFKKLSEDEYILLGDNEQKSYDFENHQRKKEKLLNKLYDNLVSMVADGTYSLDDISLYNEWKKVIDENVNNVLVAIIAQEDEEKKILEAHLQVDKYKKLGSSVQKTKKGYKLDLDTDKLNDTQAKSLLEQLIFRLKEIGSDE